MHDWNSEKALAVFKEEIEEMKKCGAEFLCICYENLYVKAVFPNSQVYEKAVWYDEKNGYHLY